jgi:hypothetical protein
VVKRPNSLGDRCLFSAIDTLGSWPRGKTNFERR